MLEKILAIIPARGGSKGIPRKNIKQLLGKPLLAWTIDEAKKSRFVSKIIVSTDDNEIALVSRKYGAEVPFMRPAELASDTAKSADVVLHALDFFEKQNEFFDYVILLEPTSPLRTVDDIDECLCILLGKKEAKAIVSVAKLESSHPEFNVIINSEGYIKKPDGSSTFKVLRRQELEDIYFFDGSIYVSEVNIFKKEKTFYHDKTLGYTIAKYKSIEIDELSDFICVEALMDSRNRGII
jgi:N-acylneuraminate cytidylyltransferase/CMP-N,N'-diacetyllegionaminic acid synthase